MTQSYRRPNYTTSNFSYDAWRLSGKPSCRKIPVKDEFAIAGKSPESSSILAKRHIDEPEKAYHPFIVVGSCNGIDNLSENTLSNKYSISTHSVDRTSKYTEQFSFSSSLSIRRKEFTSLDNGLQKRSTTSINLEKGSNHGKTFSSSVKTKRYTTVQSQCAQSNNSPTCETLKKENKSTSKLEIKKFPVKRTSTPSHRKRISVKSFFSKKKNSASDNSVQDVNEVGCSSWRSSTTKSPFSSPCKIPLAVASREDIDRNNNYNKPSESPRKKVYYSEKQSGDINGAPSVPPTTPDYTLNDTIGSLADLKSQRNVIQKLLRIGTKRQEKESLKIKKEKEQEKIRMEKVKKEVIASQRRQIYFLNKIMTKLENDRFEEFKVTQSGAPV